ncbi:MAG: methylenetetrahydrofolate reductase [Pseudomonadota bacterium]
MSFRKRLQSGEFLVIAEMNTPKGVDISRFVTDARRIKGRVDAVVIPDMDNGVMRMSALAGGVLALQQGLEPMIHCYGRDRNRMAVQGDLLAAHVLGIQNIVVVQGEEMDQSDHADAKPVDDLDEMGLLGAIDSLQKGQDLGGFDLDGSPEFTVGCSIGAWADGASVEKELDAAGQKVAAGARFIITPPVFDTDRFARFLEAAAFLDVPIIPSVFLIKSVAVARYIATHEADCLISEDMIRRMRKSADREMEGVKIAGEIVARLREMARGVLIQTMGWEHRLPVILDIAGL